MKIIKQMRGWVRLWIWGLCPKCNSDAPELYNCPICGYYKKVPRYHVTKKQKVIAWKDYKQTLKGG